LWNKLTKNKKWRKKFKKQDCAQWRDKSCNTLTPARLKSRSLYSLHKLTCTPCPISYENQTNLAQKPAKWDEFWWYNTWYLVLDERRNLLPDDLQWFGMKILTQKIALFGFLKVDGKKMMLGVWTDEFCAKTVTLRKLTITAWVNLCSVT